MSQATSEALEAIRNRLNQVHLSLRKLADQINGAVTRNSRQLPIAQLHQQFQVLITQLSSISLQLQAHEDQLRTSNVYPLPSFPTTQQESLVTTLLRKKALPEVESWIESCSTGLTQNAIDAEWCYAKAQELSELLNMYGFSDGSTAPKSSAGEAATEPAEWTPDMVLQFLNRGQTKAH